MQTGIGKFKTFKWMITKIKLFLKMIFIPSKSCCKLTVLIAFFSIQNVSAQERISLSTLLDSSLKNSPVIKGSYAGLNQQKQLLKSAVNLPSPELLLQNPTGNFYTVGVQQIFDFPTVYGSQRKVQKGNIKLAETNLKNTEIDVKYRINVLYTELQYRHQLMKLWQIQDSLYQIIAQNAIRSFQAGSIDYVQTSYAKVQAGQVKANFSLAESAYKSTLYMLQSLSGISRDFIPDTLAISETRIVPDTGLINNLTYRTDILQVAVDEQRVSLEKQKVLPGFTIAYLNQGEKSTIFENRFYAGLRIPIWFWQYKGNIAAAKARVEESKYKTAADMQELRGEMQGAYNNYLTYGDLLFSYRSGIIADADALSNAAARFYNSGSTAYSDYLRNLNDMNEVRMLYLEAIKNYNQSLIYIQYLNGTL